MNPHFIVHEPKDSVGVVVVDQIGAGEEVSGWVMETDETISMIATEVVPLGHKPVSYTHLTLPTNVQV